MSKKSLLEQEIAYYTELIKSHNLQTRGNASSSKKLESSVYSSSKQSNRIVLAANDHIKSNRIVVKPGLGSGNRIVIKEGKQKLIGNSINARESQSGYSNKAKTLSASEGNKYVWVRNRTTEKPKFKSNTCILSPVAKLKHDLPANLTECMQISHRKKTNPARTVTSNGANLSTKHLTSTVTETDHFSKQSFESFSKGTQFSQQNTPEKKTVLRKYKIVRNACDKTASDTSPHISNSGKRLISKYKIRRRSLDKKQKKMLILTKSSASPKFQKRGVHNRLLYKIDRRKKDTKYVLNEKKSYFGYSSRTRDSRFGDGYRDLYKWSRSSKKSLKSFVSRYKLVRTAQHSARYKDSLPYKQHALRKLASRVLQRSAIVSLRAKYRKNNTSKRHCTFYVRFGKCNRGDQCHYIHDPERIAVCSRFLRGTCSIENCPFSHEAKKEKVPVCQHFLRGCCLRDNCPYLHVNVGKDAPICKSFAEHRYCHLGEKCTKLHTDICPFRSENGRCPKGDKCKLRHPAKLTKEDINIRRQEQQQKQQLIPKLGDQGSKSLTEVGGEETLIHAGEDLPAYISLSAPPKQENSAYHSSLKQVKRLKTKPSFLE